MAAAAAGVIGDDTVARGPGRGEAAGRLGILRAREGFAEAIPLEQQQRLVWKPRRALV